MTTDSSKRNHHYLPQFHLRHFQAPERPKHVWRFDKQTGRTELRAIRSSAAIENLYTAEWEEGVPSDRIERDLARMESLAAPAIARLLPLSPRIHPLDAADRVAIAGYVALLHTRGPSQLEQTQAFADLSARVFTDMSLANPDDFPARARAGGMTGSDEELEAFRHAELASLRSGAHTLSVHSNARLESIKVGIEAVAPVLAGLRWYLFRRSRPPYMIIGDSPVWVVPPPDHHPVLGWAPGTPGVEVQVPLAPYCVLLMRHEPADETITVIADAGLAATWSTDSARPWWWAAHRYVFGRSRGDLDAVGSVLGEKYLRGRRGMTVSGLPAEWRGYLPDAITANNHDASQT